jgi:hypothetical protein
LAFFVTNAFFVPSIFGHICEQSHLRSQISPKIAQIANTLINRVFDGLPIKTEQQKPKNRPQNMG